MSEQIISAVDDNGKFLEHIPRMVGHVGSGRRHLGITILVYNSRGEILLQKRKHLVFDNVWCFTADTHPYRIGDVDESIEEAAKRALKEDFNIENISLKNLGFFNYFAKDGQYCENEYCAMVVGEYNGEIKMNVEHGYAFSWESKETFMGDFEKSPEKWAPWVDGGVKILKEKGYFDGI